MRCFWYTGPVDLAKGIHMSSSGYFGSYVRGRDSLYVSIECRRERLRKTQGGGMGGSQAEELLDDLADAVDQADSAT